MPQQLDWNTTFWRVTPDLLGVVDSSGQFTQTNPAWNSVLGYSAEEVESRPFRDFLHPDDHAKSDAAFEAIQRGEPILDFELRYRHRAGGYRWISWHAVPEDGSFYCSGRDITDAKRAQARLMTRDEEAHFREQFIAVMGHDLRNPLAAMSAAMRLMRREGTTDRGAEVLDAAEASVGRMAGLIDGIMDFARVRLGDGLGLDRTMDRPLRPMLEQTAEEIRLAHPGREITETYEFADPVDCDLGRVAQVVSNLLSNAVTHGAPDRPVALEARDHVGTLQIRVENAGDAIPPETRAKLFEPFGQAGKRISQHGLGLGLFIASEIATAHGGALTVASTDERTTFTLNLPR